jgi:rubrerythrin
VALAWQIPSLPSMHLNRFIGNISALNYSRYVVTMNVEDARKIISNAIDSEVEAYTYYTSVSDRATDPALKKLFGELAGEEKKHREFLQSFLTKDTADLKFTGTHDYKVVDALPTPKLTNDLKPIDGLVLAIKKELEAMQTYTQLATLSTDSEQELLFSQLANMERTHKARLEDLYVEMTFPEVW